MLLSVVVPVYQVESYLAQCLDSILDAGVEDLELIAVDDRSPDGSAAILATYAARDRRVRVVSLPENVGLGRARNAGLDAASGEFVWFLDSDDWLADGTLPEVAAVLRELDPDVLLVDHLRVWPDGRTEATGLAQTFTGPPVVRSAREDLRIFGILHTAWNKITRRDLLQRLGLRFGPGWYEDVSFSLPLLAVAPRVAVLPRVGVRYRQRQTGAITRTVTDRHFEVLDHWDEVFRWLDAWTQRPPADLAPPDATVRGEVFYRMVSHLLTVLGIGERLPPASRARFFFRAADLYHRHLPPTGYPKPGGVAGLKHRLLARRAWRTFTVLRAVYLSRRVAAAAVRRTLGGRPGPTGAI